MIRVKKMTGLIICILALSPIATFADSGNGYTVEHYEVTIELVPDDGGGLRDAAVTLSMTYDISDPPQSSLCKFIGQFPVQDVSVNDGNDQPLKFELEESDQHKLTWHFSEAKRGQQTIVAHFTVVGALEGSLAENTLNFEWVESWEVPVRDVVYRFILPENYTYEKLTMYPGDNDKQLTEYKGRRAVETHLDGVRGYALQVRFSPGIAEQVSYPARKSLMTQGCTVPSPQATNMLPGLIVIGLIIIFGASFAIYARRQDQRGVRYGDAQADSQASGKRAAGQIDRRRVRATLWFGLAAFFLILSLVTGYHAVGLIPPSSGNRTSRWDYGGSSSGGWSGSSYRGSWGGSSYSGSWGGGSDSGSWGGGSDSGSWGGGSDSGAW